MQPDEQVFRSHIEAGPFQSGVDRGRWRLLSIEWPYALIAIRAAARERAPDEYVLRFECCNYPQAAPTAQLWDIARGLPLEQRCWPVGRVRVQFAFNPAWNSGQCLYLPCDRLAIVGHDAWRNQHPTMIWSSASNITLYLRIVHDLLNSSEYTGTRGP
jgi:hypothetical protein